MKKKGIVLIALVCALSMILAACGEAKTAAPAEKVTATAVMDEGDVPVEVIVDASYGYSVVFDSDGFLLFEGEFDDTTYPLVTATILSKEVYDKYIEDNKDRESFREDDGIMKYTSSIGESVCIYMIEDKVPFMMTFEKSVDGDKADNIIGCLEFNCQ